VVAGGRRGFGFGELGEAGVGPGGLAREILDTGHDQRAFLAVVALAGNVLEPQDQGVLARPEVALEHERQRVAGAGERQVEAVAEVVEQLVVAQDSPSQEGEAVLAAEAARVRRRPRLRPPCGSDSGRESDVDARRQRQRLRADPSSAH
jgi:hypothetical protein